jgi:hypothetical protein
MKKPWHVTAVAATVLIALIVFSGVPGRALLQLPGPIKLPGTIQLPDIPLLPPGPTVEIDPLLSQVLSAAGSGQLVEAVVTYDRHPTAIDLAVVRATGVALLPFRVLPMVGVRGTPPQILSLFPLPGLQVDLVAGARNNTYFSPTYTEARPRGKDHR